MYENIFESIRHAVEKRNLRERTIQLYCSDVGCLKWFFNEETKQPNFGFVFYDKTPGGAGHVRRMADPDILRAVFEASLTQMPGCTCGGESMERLRCVVERITYQNETNGYSVIKCRAKGYQDLITVVGTMPETHVCSVLTLGGSWRVNSKYGRQFSVETYEETLPATVYGIEKYLGSGLVKGIGPKFAQRIVKQFGADTLNVIEENPDKLLAIPGIGKVRVERIKKAGSNRKRLKTSYSFCRGMMSARPMPQRSIRPMETKASRLCRKIPIVLPTISGALASGRRTPSHPRWASVMINIPG